MTKEYRALMEKLTIEDHYLILDIFFSTAKKLIIENAPSDLDENQLKRYVYQRMYDEPPPAGLWE